MFGSDTNVNFHYRINPPKISSHLLLTVNAVYDHYKPAIGFEQEIYATNRYGISNIRVLGKIEAGDVLRLANTFMNEDTCMLVYACIFFKYIAF